MYVHDEPTMEFLPKVQNLTQYIRTYSRSTATFGAFVGGWMQTPNQLSIWRDVDDVPMIDNYPIAYNLPIGGSAPTAYPTLTPGPDAISGKRWSAAIGLEAAALRQWRSNHLADNAGHAADRFRPAGLGRGESHEVGDVFSGREYGVGWRSLAGLMR